MNRHVLMTLLETIVFTNIMQIITTDDNGTLHLLLHHNTSQDSTTNGDIASKWALLINVIAIDSLFQEYINVSYKYTSKKFSLPLWGFENLDQLCGHIELPCGI